MSEKQLELQEEEKHAATATPAVSTSTIEPSEEAPKDKADEKPKYKREKGPAVSMLQLFRFSTPKERVLLVLAFIFSIGSGALQPVSILIYGTFINNLTGSLNDPSALLETTLPVIHIMAYMGTASLIAAYLSNCLWVMTGESQTRRIRSLYLHSVLKQDMSWFDKAADGSLNTRLASDTQLIQDGISEKMGLLVQLVAQFIGGFVVAFVKGKVFFFTGRTGIVNLMCLMLGWQVAVIMLATLPLMFGTGRVMAYFITKYTVMVQQSYALAGSVAESCFQSIRTIYSFTLQKRFSKRYDEKLEEACQFGIKRSVALGLGFATFMFVLFCTYGLALWYGSTKGKRDCMFIRIMID